ncbi:MULTISPECIES: SDR family oxidoreductase [Streptomyces]|uniref:LysR family transcriptional regulator n=1 Tax=Streptomyces canarius TaxID=285453 RepID=A0ABQ3D4M0_9ACTN|nr:NAD(P)H-binding protein [Streptomyces canarius]GHA55242.1 LysR family transcriptional regulator [Streptomyces canarius]
MRVVVVGGTGLIRSPLVDILRDHGHDARSGFPGTGVDAFTGGGLDELLGGADVVVDVSNAPFWDADTAMRYVTRSTGHLTEAAVRAGVRHLVILSSLGVDRLPGMGCCRAKLAQERAVRDSGLPYSVVRAGLYFEFVELITGLAVRDGQARLPSTRVRPVAASDTALALAAVVESDPLRGVRRIAGPEVHRLDRLGEITLAGRGGLAVVTDETAGPFAGIPADVLTGDPGVETWATRYEDWCKERPVRCGRARTDTDSSLSHVV